MLVFSVGGGMSFYEGIAPLRHPAAPTDPTWDYVVLGLSLVFEGISCGLAFRPFNLQPRSRRRRILGDSSPSSESPSHSC